MLAPSVCGRLSLEPHHNGPFPPLQLIIYLKYFHTRAQFIQDNIGQICVLWSICEHLMTIKGLNTMVATHNTFLKQLESTYLGVKILLVDAKSHKVSEPQIQQEQCLSLILDKRYFHDSFLRLFESNREMFKSKYEMSMFYEQVKDEGFKRQQELMNRIEGWIVGDATGKKIEGKELQTLNEIAAEILKQQ